MLTMFLSRCLILSHSTSNPASSLAGCLFSLAFCHCAKILKDQFVRYCVDFGKDFSSKAFCSSGIFNSLNFLPCKIFNLALLQPSTATEKGLKEKKHACKITIQLIRSTCLFLYANIFPSQFDPLFGLPREMLECV